MSNTDHQSDTESLYLISDEPWGGRAGVESVSPRPITIDAPPDKQAEIATENVISNVSFFLKHHKDETEARRQEIAHLQKQYEQSTQKYQSTSASLQERERELEEKTLILEKLYNKNEELKHVLNTEYAAFAQLKCQMGSMREQLEQARHENSKLVSRQYNEKNVRDELLTEIESMQLEITTLDREKSQLQHEFSELEMKLNIEMEGFDVERTKWKQTQTQLLAKIQAGQQALHAEQDAKQSLEEQLETIVDRNNYLEHQLHAQERQLGEVNREYAKTQETLKQLRSQLKDQQAVVQTKTEQQEEAQNKLRGAMKDMRAMSEKVFQLMQQLQEMEHWKVKTNEELSELQHELADYVRKIDSLNKANKELSKDNQKLQKQLANLKERLDKSQLSVNSYKQKYVQVAKEKKQLQLSLKGQEKQLMIAKKNNQKVSHQLVSSKSSEKRRIQQRKDLEQKVKSLTLSQRSLKHQVTTMQQDQDVMLKVLRRKEVALSQWAEKERLFTQLKTAMLSEADAVEVLESIEDFEDKLNRQEKSEYDDITSDDIASQLEQRVEQRGAVSRTRRPLDTTSLVKRSIANSKSKKNTSSTSNNKIALVKKLLQSTSGQHLVEILREMQVRESDIVRWATSPSEFFKGLYAVLTNINASLARFNKEYDAKEQELTFVQAKNSELVGRAAEMEKSKTKAVMKLAHVLAEYGTMKNFAQSMTSNQDPKPETKQSQQTFVTQSMDRNDKTVEATVSGTDVHIVDLASNDIDDSEVKFLAEALKQNSLVTEMRLSRNNIKDSGLMELVLASLYDDCSLQVLDLRFNQITGRGFETLMSYIQECCRVSTVVAASLSEERGRRLIPYIGLKTATKLLWLDVRHNPIFDYQTSQVKKRETLARYASILSSCSKEPMSRAIVPRDITDDDDFDEQPPRTVSALDHNRTLVRASDSKVTDALPKAAKWSSRITSGATKATPAGRFNLSSMHNHNASRSRSRHSSVPSRSKHATSMPTLPARKSHPARGNAQNAARMQQRHAKAMRSSVQMGSAKLPTIPAKFQTYTTAPRRNKSPSKVRRAKLPQVSSKRGSWR